MIGRLLGVPTLQRRVSVLTAVAVAAAVFLTGLAGYVTARVSLYAQLDQELVQVATASTEQLGNDVTSMGGLSRNALAGDNEVIVVLRADGQTQRVPGQTTILQLSAQELSIARLQQGSSARNGRASNGAEYRIIAVPMTDLPGNHALIVARRLAPYQAILASLLWVLITFGALAIVASWATGAAVARSSLRPVRELSAAVTHITKTDDLAPIAVRGHDELSQLSRSFNAMVLSLQASRERQQRLIADAGHELRTPLTSLRTNIELLVADDRTGMLPEGARADILRDVAAQLGEFTTLIQDLVQLAREDRVEPDPEPVDLRDILVNALERAKRRGPGLHFDVELNPLYLIGEPDTLERAITNLLDNAIKFSPPGGTIRVLLEGDRLRVSDQGPGIAEEDLPKVFDRFYRADSSRNTPGTGLGLSIVAQTIARHGGWVRAGQSAEGGAEFTVRLPGSPSAQDLGADDEATTILQSIVD